MLVLKSSNVAKMCAYFAVIFTDLFIILILFFILIIFVAHLEKCCSKWGLNPRGRLFIGT